MTICDTGLGVHNTSVTRSNRHGFDVIDIVCLALDNQHGLFISPPSILFLDCSFIVTQSNFLFLTLAVVLSAGRDCNIFVFACQR